MLSARTQVQNVNWAVGPVPDGILNYHGFMEWNRGSLTLLATVNEHVEDGSHDGAGIGRVWHTP